MPPAYTAEPPRPGAVVPLLDDLHWLRLPLPFALDHVNVWLLDDADGWTIIDTGVANAACRQIWDGLLGGGGLLDGKPVRRIVATHFHPDHAGLFGELCRRTGAEPCMSRTEWLTARALSLDASEAFAEAGMAYDRAAGLDPALIEERAARGNLYRLGVTPLPIKIERLEAGDTLTMGGRRWTVRVGRGHAPEMTAFVSDDEGVLIAADQILPRISPVVGLWPTTPEKDPLDDFLVSLEGFLDLPEDILVLPSHDAPFKGLHRRIHALKRHHEGRLRVCLEGLAEPTTAADLMPRLYARELDVKQVGFALAETLAHLRYLERRGSVRGESGPEGTARWHRS